jgi:hypothetical protein
MTAATLVAALLIERYTLKEVQFVDPDGWGRMGFEVAAGKGLIIHGKPSAYRGPVVPVIFATAALLFGPSLEVLLVTQCVFFALANGVLGLIAQRVFSDRRVTFLTMLLYLGYVPAYPWFCHIFTEPIFTTLLALFVLTWMVALERGGVWHLFTGVTLALAALCRPVMYFFMPFVLLLPLLRAGFKRHVLRSLGLLTVGFLLLEVPWVVRNCYQTGQPVLTTSGGSQAFFLMTWYQQANWLGNPFDDPKRFPPQAEGFWALPEEQQNAIFRRMAWDNIREAPLSVLLLVPRRLLIFLFQMQATGWLPTAKSLLFGGAIYLLALLGYVLSPRSSRSRVAPCLWLLGFNVLFHSLLVAEYRYSHPIQPYFFMLASAGVFLVSARLLARMQATAGTEAAGKEHQLY